METWFLLWRSDSRVNMWCSVPACMYCSECWWWRCLHHNTPVCRCPLSWAEHVVSYCVHRVCVCDTELHVSCVHSLDTLCLQLFLSVVLEAECVCHSFHVDLVHTVQSKGIAKTHTDTHTYGQEANYTVHHAQSRCSPSTPLSPAIILLDISPFHLQMTDTIESGHSHSASGTFSSKNRDHNKSQCGQGQ